MSPLRGRLLRSGFNGLRSIHLKHLLVKKLPVKKLPGKKLIDLAGSRDSVGNSHACFVAASYLLIICCLIRCDHLSVRMTATAATNASDDKKNRFVPSQSNGDWYCITRNFGSNVSVSGVATCRGQSFTALPSIKPVSPARVVDGCRSKRKRSKRVNANSPKLQPKATTASCAKPSLLKFNLAKSLMTPVIG